MREELADFLRFCAFERRLAPLTCAAYKRDVSACLGYLQAKPLELRRAERELFFWTARETLKLTVWIALIAYFLISLVLGMLAGNADIVELASKVIALLR
jgi:hypothetical protein